MRNEYENLSHSFLPNYDILNTKVIRHLPLGLKATVYQRGTQECLYFFGQ